jgi:murein DD-endopeptidase MepM/ murein hydrolase activator NlpD
MKARDPLLRGAFTALITTMAVGASPGAAVANPAAPQGATSALTVANSSPTHASAVRSALQAAKAELAQAGSAFDAAKQRQQQAAERTEAARTAAKKARTEAESARNAVRQSQRELDEFAAASYQQGMAVGVIASFVKSRSPVELLGRASFLNTLTDSQLDVLHRLQQDRARTAEAEKAANTALRKAEAAKAAADHARTEAEQRYNRAVAEQDAAQERVDELAARDNRSKQQTAAANGGSNPAPAAGVVAPAEGRLTSTYGSRNGGTHYGIDIANDIGTPIVSVMDGEVISSGPASGFGMWVRVRHDDGLITVYGHINESTVSVGQQVSAGEQIATLGNRGQSTGPHLHFEVLQGGSKINPLPWLRDHGVSL